MIEQQPGVMMPRKRARLVDSKRAPGAACNKRSREVSLSAALAVWAVPQGCWYRSPRAPVDAQGLGACCFYRGEDGRNFPAREAMSDHDGTKRIPRFDVLVVGAARQRHEPILVLGAPVVQL